MRLWEKEFGRGYDVPSKIEALGWTDISWHNDMCPSFTPDPNDPDIRLWVEHPDPSMREFDDQPRYAINRISVMEEQGYDKSVIVAGDDLAKILEVAGALAPRRIVRLSRARGADKTL